MQLLKNDIRIVVKIIIMVLYFTMKHDVLLI